MGMYPCSMFIKNFQTFTETDAHIYFPIRVYRDELTKGLQIYAKLKIEGDKL